MHPFSPSILCKVGPVSITLMALAACSPAPPPPVSPAPTASQPASAAPAELASQAFAPLPDQPPVQAYAAGGQAPVWQAAIQGQTLTLTLPGGARRTVAVAPRTYARGVEFSAEDAGGRVVLAITSEQPCRDAAGQPTAYAATLIVGHESHKGCAEPV